MLLAACVVSLPTVAFHIVTFHMLDSEPYRMVYHHACGACEHGLWGCSGMVWVLHHNVVQLDQWLPMVDVEVHGVGVACQLTCS
jgi:hypothetical protein